MPQSPSLPSIKKDTRGKGTVPTVPGLRTDTVISNSGEDYLRPNGVDTFRRPGGVDTYKRP